MSRRNPGPATTSPYLSALRRLARRDHTEAELRRALQRQRFPEPDVELAIQRLRKERYLDDSNVAARFALTALKHRGHGRIRVGRDLRARGLSRPLAAAALAQALAELPETDALDALARRYWRQRAREAPERRARKLYAFLLRRGFPALLVQERLGALWPRWREAFEGGDPVEEE